MTISPDGTAFDIIGPKGAPVIVLIHGLGLTRQTWSQHVPSLAERYRVLTYDLCGHGESALPSIPPSLAVLTNQLHSLMDYLEIDTAALVGFSLGGMINRKFAMTHPDRTSALIILNSPHERASDAQLQVEQRARDTADGGPSATIGATLERWFTSDFLINNTKIVAWVRNTVMSNNHQNYADHRFVLAAGVTELIRPSPPICHPTLIMTCENDTGSTPVMSHSIASEIQGAKTIIIPHLQHLGLLEQPGLFTQPISAFLNAHFDPQET